MPTVAAQLLFRVDPAPLPVDSVATLLFDVRRATAAHPHLLFDVAQVVGAFAQLWPFRNPTVTQTVWPVVTMSIRGTDFEFYPSDLVGDIEITLQPDGTAWSVTLRQQAEGSDRSIWLRPPTLWEVDWGTVAPAISDIAFDLRYRTAALEVISYPIMAQGVARRNRTDVFGSTIEISGAGAEARYDKLKGSLALEAGHGLSVGEIADLLFADAGIPAGFGKVGEALQNPVDVTCERAWGVAEEMFDQWNFQLSTSETGAPALLPKAPVAGAPRFTLNEHDLTTLGAFDIDIDADVPTCISVEGGEVVSDAEDGAVTRIEVQLIFDDFAVGQALFFQASGTFLPTGFSTTPPVQRQLKRRITTYITTVAGCEIRREIIEEAWVKIEVARYRISAATPELTFILINGFIYDEGATDGDENRAYLFSQEHFGVERNTVIETARDEIGRELTVTKTVGGWFAPRTAIKDRVDASFDWETEDHLNNTLLFGSKEGQASSANAHDGANYYRGASSFELLASHGLPGVAGFGSGAFSVPGFLTLEVEGIDFIPVIEQGVEVGGFKTRDFRDVTIFDRFPGNLFLFGDAVESRDTDEVQHLLDPIEETTYSAQGLLSHSKTTTRYKLDGTIDGEQLVELGIGGSLPAVNVCDPKTNEQTVPLRVTICLETDEDIFITNESDSIRVDWLETIESIQSFILRLFREETAIVATGTVPANASLRPLMEGEFDFSRRGYDERICWVETVQHPRSAAEPGQPAQLMTALVIKIPTVVDS